MRLEKDNILWIILLLLLVGITAQGQTEKQTKRILKTFNNYGYENVKIISAEKIWYDFQYTELDGVLQRNFPNSKTIRIFDKSYNVIEPKGKWIWIVIYTQNNESKKVRMFNKNLKRIIK